jgi:hypothetical protein
VPRDSGLPGFEEARRALDSAHGDKKAHWAFLSGNSMIHKDKPTAGLAWQHAHPAGSAVDPNFHYNPRCTVGPIHGQLLANAKS